MLQLTDAQVICALFALPFLTLAIAFVIGLAVLDWQDRKTVRKLRAMVREPMR